MNQLQGLMGDRAKIIDTTIAPITVMLLVVVINYFTDVQYGSLNGSVEHNSHTYMTEHDANLDASDDKTPTKLYWKDRSNVSWYLQAVQGEDNNVIIAANITHPFGINTAAVFAKTKQELQYTLSNYGVLGYLTVDPTSEVNGTYNVTIFENQRTYPPSVFADSFDNGTIKIVSGPLNNHCKYPLYLMVDKSSYVVMATKNISEATEFYTGTTTFSNHCPP